jgi:RNA-binding signal recognition particle 68
MDITDFILAHREKALSTGDFGTYRSQLSTQIANLRRRLGISTPKSSKFRPESITVQNYEKNKELVLVKVADV